ncbi:TPA: restriction endonuclease subunit S [Pseudomonas aeruginosa]|nr:restriction endonuclease subunit S [Pseudomonas aeruginosa]
MSWPSVKLEAVSEFIRNGASIKQSNDAAGLPITRIETIADRTVNLDKCGYADVSEVEYLNYRLRNGDILISHINSEKHLAKCAIFESDRGDIVHGMNLLCLRPSCEVVFSKYLFHYLSSSVFLRLIPAITKKSVNQASFTVTAFKDLEIPLPPLPEQKRIAAILDKADAIRRKRQQAIQLADDFLRAVFLDMFGDPVTNPKGWAVRPVGDLCDCIVPGRDKPKSFNGSTPWITTNELIHLGVTFKKENYIGLTVDEISEVRARVVPKESVIMTCVGDLGVVSVAGENMVINQQLHAFLPSEEIAPSYLSFSLASQKGYMLKMASSTTLPYMNKTVCNSVPVMLPPKEMQDKFESLVAKVAAFKLKSTGFSDETAFQAISQKAFSGQL